MSTNDNLFQLYLNSVMQLAATIVVKSDDTVAGLNDYVTEIFGYPVDELDLTTWKYYLNISGEYHPTDTVMQVVSMDTLETIDFTKENLAVHLATAAGYQYGTRAYNELVSQYPQIGQELLILGILYPADINFAINAIDGTILSIPPNLIESNEYSLQTRIQNWLYAFKQRWVNKQYNISDDLYPLFHHTIMFTMLPLAVLGFRLEACKTNEAHSFHVQMYLGSHLSLDDFLQYMTLEQSLWFYRNISYIERNIGQKQIFDLLLEHIMTDRNLPLAQYLMQHDISQMPTQLDPTITFVRTPFNFDANSTSDVVDLDELLDKEQPLARDNAAFQPDYEPGILQAMQYSASSTLKTKVLESSMIDYSNSSPYVLSDILLHHWLWLASNGVYQAFISATNPQTSEAIPLSVKDAWTLMWYCWMTSNGIDLSEQVIPQMFAERVQRIPTPSIEDLMSVVDPSLVSTATAQLALFHQPTINPVLSTEAFYNLCVQITLAANAQLNLTALQEHKDGRAMVQNLCERIYSDNIVQTADTGQTYQSWFTERNLNLSQLSNDDLNLLYLDILAKATGVDLVVTKSLAQLQAAMVSMYARLSSYNIQFATEINTSAIRMVNFPVIRVGNIEASGASLVYLPDTAVDVLYWKAKGFDRKYMDVNSPRVNAENFFQKGKAKKRVKITVGPQKSPHSFIINGQMQMRINVRVANPPGPNSEGVIPVPGIDQWLALPLTERVQFYDQYGNDSYYYYPPGDVELSAVVTKTDLNGLVWDGE